MITWINRGMIESLTQSLDKQYSLKDLGNLSYFLRFRFLSYLVGVFISHRKNIPEELLSKSNMTNSKGVHSPMTTGSKLSAFGSNPIQDVHL